MLVLLYDAATRARANNTIRLKTEETKMKSRRERTEKEVLIGAAQSGQGSSVWNHV